MSNAAPQPTPQRTRAIDLVRAQLARKGSPYFILIVVLTATGLAGFLFSVLLLACGLNSMAVRYPVAVALAYLVFLFQLYLFVLYHRQRGRRPNTQEDGGTTTTDVVNAGLEVGVDVADVAMTVAPPPPPIPPAPRPSAPASGGGNWGSLGDLGGGGDDPISAILVVIVILVLVVIALIASAVVIAEAPILLAEIIVDGVLVAGLGRQLQGANQADWVFSVLKRTMVPAFVVALAFSLGGLALQSLSPGARTMGEALRFHQPQRP